MRRLRSAHLRLRPGGLIFVGVPNLRSVDVLRHGAAASCFKRDHLYYFDRRSLQLALREAGFATVRPLVFWGGFNRSLAFELAQFGARLLGTSTQLTMLAQR